MTTRLFTTLPVGSESSRVGIFVTQKFWAENNVRGKKGFQPKAAPAQIPMWRGQIYGGSAEQQEIVREALGRIPAGLLAPTLSVRFDSQLKARGEKAPGQTFGMYQNRQIVLYTPIVKVSRSYSREDLIREIVHEGGHAVMARIGWPTLVGMPHHPSVTIDQLRKVGTSPEVKAVSPYARKNSDEGWAEAFTIRVNNRIPNWRVSPETEAVFTKLGI